MAKAGRAILAILAGMVVWAVLWNLGTLGTRRAFPELVVVDRITHLGVLLGYIGFSVALSLLAGWVTAAVARRNPMPLVWVLAVIHLILGIIAETSYWGLMPVWYHLVFLALVVPATVAGGLLRVRQLPAPAAGTGADRRQQGLQGARPRPST